MVEIWVLSRVELWVVQLQSFQIITCWHVRRGNGACPPSTFHPHPTLLCKVAWQLAGPSPICDNPDALWRWSSSTALVLDSACLPRPPRVRGVSHRLPTAQATLAALLARPLWHPGRSTPRARVSGVGVSTIHLQGLSSGQFASNTRNSVVSCLWLRLKKKKKFETLPANSNYYLLRMGA